MPDLNEPPGSLRGLARADPGWFTGLLVLLAANLALPLFYTHRWAYTLDYLSVFLLAFWTAGLCWRRAVQEGHTSFWLLGLGGLLSGFRYLPTFLNAPFSRLLGPGLAILGLLALAAGFLAWPQRERVPRDRTRSVLDGLAIALALFMGAWMAFDGFQGLGGQPRSSAILYLAQVAASLGVLSLWLLQESRLRLPERDPGRTLVRATLVALLAHSVLTGLLRALGHYRAGYLAHVAESLSQAALVLLAFAALSPASPAQAEPARGQPSRWRALIPAALPLAVLLLGWVHLLQPGHPASRSLAALGLALFLVLMVRHSLLVLDLERFSQDLERRVEERTRQLEAHHRQALADQRMRMMAGLAAGLTHDLNNLLSIIRLRVELLWRNSAPHQDAHLRVLEEASDQASAMTRRILATTQKQEIAPEAFDLGEWLTAGQGLLRALLNLDQRLVLDVAGPAPVRADPHTLDQVLQNLVANARDAMGAEGTVRLEVRDLGATVQLAVRDTGPGIPPDLLPHMFEPFFTTKEKGTGLGLATVKNLVGLNRGTVRIESAPGQGTAFLIGLPKP